MATKDDTPLAVLRALRAHLIGGKSVKVEGEELVFLDASGSELRRLQKHAPTAYHSKKLDKSYDLLAVHTCFKHADLSFSDYVLKCREEKAAMVSTVDKKELVAFLKGDIDSSPQILDARGKHSTTSSEKDQKTAAKKLRENESEARAAKKKKLVQEENNRRKLGENHKVQEGDDDRMKKILDREYVNRTRTTVLDAQKTKFDSVIKTLELVNAETKEKIEKASKATALMATTTTKKEQLPLHRLVKERISGTPIIVVPAGFSDLFTMLNARDFLVDGVYISNMQKKADGHRKEQSMMISHEEDGHMYTFKIVDTVNRFKDKDWRSVVGVIVSGQAWQFKGWKWKFPLEVFKKVCGVHIYNQGSQLNSEIKQWDVKVLMIHPDKRHLDKVAAKEFWRYMFAFIKHKLQ
ncbi:RNA polymerase II assessory factor Cdc73p [Plasmopara halstedii]|uniref:RNA polymerase II assessory factor Cdc73p n=1 Tax=Plasmopara halstedii TaxID=4781 RepID=A0A0P1AAI0_PLAHL|nr:RNA polymerase II assessory factor Cdc73p [Plasmopara halstedii]CEG37241.1 RNA polymerase II assessory factor Cdc73p [Plasmopara halstedii]|eukprot:XP_024573610.1 RNA polymerase II assessory factor Cdc73p [Plasmopara halstedii]